VSCVYVRVCVREIERESECVCECLEYSPHFSSYDTVFLAASV